VTRVGFEEGGWIWFVEHGGHRRKARVVREGQRVHVLSEGQLFSFVEEPRFPDHREHAVAGGLTAPMPGKVVKVLVSVDQSVESGAPLVVLEAMKMEHTIVAPAKGVVSAVNCTVGERVAEGADLVDIDDQTK
jgi:3-methylcrotonyl-CoA carboxylase alpha subunit